MEEPEQGDLITGDANVSGDVNQNEVDLESREIASRKMLRNGDSEDDLVENGEKWISEDKLCFSQNRLYLMDVK